jgi:hypothetical protein
MLLCQGIWKSILSIINPIYIHFAQTKVKKGEKSYINEKVTNQNFVRKKRNFKSYKSISFNSVIFYKPQKCLMTFSLKLNAH